MSEKSQDKWDKIYKQQEKKPSACLVLQYNQHLLPEHGDAVDIACGLGGNATLLAKAGLNVQAWDISPIAIQQLQQQINKDDLTISASVRNMDNVILKENSVDVIVVSYFLDRNLCPELVRALRPGGLLFYQTYCQQRVNQQGPSNPDYFLTDNELLTLFYQLKIRVYREESLVGDHRQGTRNQALLIAEKLP